jgi:hypothetical protein
MSVNELSTIILRFRDLVTDRGQTVAQHISIINNSNTGYVWWGWWRKRDETVPDDVFRDLAKRAKAGGFCAYLIDSGQDLLYKIICTDIKWDPNLIEIESPEAAKTPEYYNQRAYLAWFKLTEIAEVTDPESVLRRYSYLRVDEFFEDKESNYAPFYGKRIYSVKELRQQDRTIWFVRDVKSDDPTHEVSLLNSRAVTPVHFSPEYFESKSTTLLWISDPHFSADGHHAFPFKPTANKLDLGERLETDFKPRFETLAGVIISGDLTWKALPSEFELARDFLKRLNYWFRLQSDQIAICPGNHDLRFSDEPANKNKPITSVDERSSEAYATFYKELFYLAPNEFLSCGKRFLLGNAIPVDVACLNSSSLQQLKDAFQGHGFIGDKQMEHLAKQMNWEPDPNKPRAYRVAVLHHHLLPTTYSSAPEPNYPYSVVLDAEALSRWIVKYRVDLVLHGHMHQPFCARICRPFNVHDPKQGWHEFNVIGMGSSGVNEDLGEINLNTVGFLEFLQDGVAVSVHSVHPVNPSKEIWAIKLPYHRADPSCF